MPAWPAILRWAVLLAVSAGPALPQPAWPLSGELAGEVALGPEGQSPPVTWRLVIDPGEAARSPRGSWTVSAPGLAAAGQAWRDDDGGVGWSLTAASIELARWAQAVESRLPSALRGAEFRGLLRLTGAGGWRDGRLAGRVTLDLTEGRLSHPAQGWQVQGLTLKATLAARPALETEGMAIVTFEQASVAGLALTDGKLEFSLDGRRQLHLARATASVMGGRIDVAPLSLALDQPEIRADLRLAGLELAAINRLLPPVLTEAVGRLSGRVTTTWTVSDGLRPGPGELRVEASPAARLRLTPQPGFLTGRVPPRLSVLPASLGALAAAFSAANPVHETVRALEMGEVMLEVGSLEVALQPEGDTAGRSAHVVVMGRPAHGDAVQGVRFELNVRGPLTDVIRLGLEKGLRIDARAGAAR